MSTRGGGEFGEEVIERETHEKYSDVTDNSLPRMVDLQGMKI